MRYKILGPVHIVTGNDSPPVGTHKMEVLLRALLIRNGQILSLDQLTRELWGEKPPIRARASIHVYVSQLRKVLNRFSQNDEVIITRTPGYILNLGRDELDLELFLALSEKARMQMSMHQYTAATQALTDALGLWREPIQASAFEGPIIREFANWAEELRVECLEMRARSLLASNETSEAVRILYALTSEYPLREKFHALLMESLSLSGRRADALEVYQTARSQIRAELGLEPCGFLQKTHEYILNDRLDALSVIRSRSDGMAHAHTV